MKIVVKIDDAIPDILWKEEQMLQQLCFVKIYSIPPKVRDWKCFIYVSSSTFHVSSILKLSALFGAEMADFAILSKSRNV